MPEYQSSLACLEKLIGLAQSTCPCNTTGRPSDYNESLSGLFMDDYEHGLSEVFAESAMGCGDGSIWDVLAKARYEGVNDAITYLFKAIGQNLNTFVDGFSGEFGEVNNRVNNTVDKGCTKNIVGFSFMPNVFKGASIKFKKIWLALDTPGSYTINLHDIGNLSSPVSTIEITHTGGSKLLPFELLAEDRIQPLSEAGKPIGYAISYARNGAFPLNYTYSCGTCGMAKAPLWQRNGYMTSSGFCVNDLSDVVPGSTCCNRNYTGGLIVEWELICDPSEWICNQDNSFWTSTQWGRIFSKVCQLLSTNKLIAAILDTGRVNFYTMISADALQEKRIAFSKLIDELISYLSQNMPSHVDHCWSCKTTQGFSKKSIIV